MKGNSKKIIITISIILLIIIVTTFGYINLKKHSPITVEATVTYVGNHYIVVEDEQKEEYSLKTTEDYNIGDKISFIIKDIKKDSYPKQGTIKKIDTISKNIEFSISDPTDSAEDEFNNIEVETIPSTDNSTETNSSTNNEKENNSSNNNQVTTKDNNNNNNNNNNQTNNSNNIQNNNTNILETNKETAVISYFENLNTDLEAYSEEKSLGESIKGSFVTVVDFLFYNGTIKGKTFNQLSTTAKLKVLQLIFTIDQKIDKHFPEYKEQISTEGNKIYTNIKTKALEKYLDLTTKVCIDNPDTCQAAKDGLADLKQSFSLTWNLIKDISGVGLSKLKAWYEVWKTA